MLRLRFGGDQRVEVQLTDDEVRRLQDRCAAHLASIPKPQLSDVSKAALAVEEARREGKQ